MDGSKLDFFRRGWTVACLKKEGTTPELKDLLMMVTTHGATEVMTCFRREVGRMSSGLEEVFTEPTTSSTSSRETGAKLLRDGKETGLGTRGGKGGSDISSYFGNLIDKEHEKGVAIIIRKQRYRRKRGSNDSINSTK